MSKYLFRIKMSNDYKVLRDRYLQFVYEKLHGFTINTNKAKQIERDLLAQIKKEFSRERH